MRRISITRRAEGAGGSGRTASPLKSKPLLPAAQNPLLGRWQQTAGKAANLGMLGQLPGASEVVNGAFGGGCQSIFGKGTVAFEPGTYNWVAPDGHEEVLNHVEYRSDGPNVIVISTDPDPIQLIFGFPSHDHAVVAFLGCTMQRPLSGQKPYRRARRPGRWRRAHPPPRPDRRSSTSRSGRRYQGNSHRCLQEPRSG